MTKFFGVKFNRQGNGNRVNSALDFDANLSKMEIPRSLSIVRGESEGQYKQRYFEFVLLFAKIFNVL